MAQQKREQWGSKFGFILAAAGSAVGLGNIWKFPYIVGENGGAAFIIVYLICVALIGLPILISEILVGRTSQRNPVGAFQKLSNSKFWTGVGAIGVFAGFIIMSFYSVVAGWSIGYLVEAVKGTFDTFGQPSDAKAHFEGLIVSVPWIIGYMVLFIVLAMSLVFFGVQKGIERGSKILMPLLFVLLIVLMVRSLTLPGSSAGLEFMFSPDWSKINAKVILEALGQAFFTLSLGMGAMMTYGSYMSKKENIITAAVHIVILDTLIAIIAGVAIFSAVFAFNLDPASEEGLIFHVVPVIFNQMPGGTFFSVLFFFLLAIAALTSVISLLEVVVAFFVDQKGWKRSNAVITCGIAASVIGIPCALSFNVMSDTKLFGATFFGIANFLSSNVLLPLGGLLLAIFVVWNWGFDKAVANLKFGAEKIFEKKYFLIKTWKFLLIYVSPILIFLVLLQSIGVVNLILEFFGKLL